MNSFVVTLKDGPLAGSVMHTDRRYDVWRLEEEGGQYEWSEKAEDYVWREDEQ